MRTRSTASGQAFMDLQSPDVGKRGTRRSSKLLWAKNVTEEHRSIYHTNAAGSPLLRLPPELRQCIWETVLGGKSIKVEGCTRYITHCTAQEYHLGLFQTEAHACSGVLCGRTLLCDCEDKRENPAVGLTLSALLVCRQIHQEAALLPFTANIFVFIDPSDLGRFMRKLVVGQSRYITAVTLLARHNYYQGDDDPPRQDTLRRLFTVKLTGLKQLVFVAEFMHLRDKWQKQTCAAVMARVFGCLRLQRVVVAMAAFYYTEERFLLEEEDVTDLRKARGAWQDELERQLLGRVEEVNDEDAEGE